MTEPTASSVAFHAANRRLLELAQLRAVADASRTLVAGVLATGIDPRWTTTLNEGPHSIAAPRAPIVALRAALAALDEKP